jgi:hypothetical protein
MYGWGKPFFLFEFLDYGSACVLGLIGTRETAKVLVQSAPYYISLHFQWQTVTKTAKRYASRRKKGISSGFRNRFSFPLRRNDE